jgi:hypothetical protein
MTRRKLFLQRRGVVAPPNGPAQRIAKNVSRNPPPALLRLPGKFLAMSFGQLTSDNLFVVGHHDDVACPRQPAGPCRRVPQPFR